MQQSQLNYFLKQTLREPLQLPSTVCQNLGFIFVALAMSSFAYNNIKVNWLSAEVVE